MTEEAIERLMPGTGTVNLFNEHQLRYQFAGGYVQNQRVLDIACGCGIGTSYLLRAGARSCIGVDISPDAVKFAAENYPGPEYFIGNALSIPLESRSVDAVVSFETIEHVKEPGRFIEECYRVLAPGGILVCSTPHLPVIRWLCTVENPFHVFEMSSSTLSELLSEKFDSVRMFAQAPVLYPSMVAKQLFVRVLNAMRITGPLLRLLGKGHFVERSKATEYEIPRENNSILPYASSWLKQPTYAIAIAQKHQ